jgi:hypothetical protein
MDAEHRHALKTNELAETLSKLKEFGEKWLNHILIGVAVIMLIWAGYRFWSWRQESALTSGWTKLLNAETDDPTAGDAPLDQIRQVIADAPDAALQTMARIKLAEALLERATGPDAQTRLTDAERELKTAFDSPSTPDLLRAAVLYQLAIVQETRRDFAAAREAYQKLTTDARFAASPFRKIAENRLADLDQIASRIEFLPGTAPKPLPPAPLVPTTSPAPPGFDPTKIDPRLSPVAPREPTDPVPADPEPAPPDQPKAEQPQPDEPKPDEPRPAGEPERP